jgi:ferrous iron transport protein A
MKHAILLTQLHPGEQATVVNLSAEGGMRRRLQDLGLIEGSKVTCVECSPLGDPTAYEICGAVIALRRENSDTVHVVKEDANVDTQGRT